MVNPAPSPKLKQTKSGLASISSSNLKQHSSVCLRGSGSDWLALCTK